MTFDANFKQLGYNIKNFKIFQGNNYFQGFLVIFQLKISYSKIFLDVYLSTDFQNFCCTFYDKFSTKYC